jgi:hypothetical protein
MAPRGDDELRRVRMDACAGRREGTAGHPIISQRFRSVKLVVERGIITFK